MWPAVYPSLTLDNELISRDFVTWPPLFLIMVVHRAVHVGSCGVMSYVHELTSSVLHSYMHTFICNNNYACLGLTLCIFYMVTLYMLNEVLLMTDSLTNSRSIVWSWNKYDSLIHGT